eukprot:GHVS01009155.1.p2 GENE.GHVS01009155.1~~GHVS01009155.1.p2  ORF type:complete len:105 (+),score=14.14 GHVS01009155.1:1123-1437(+)
MNITPIHVRNNNTCTQNQYMYRTEIHVVVSQKQTPYVLFLAFLHQAHNTMDLEECLLCVSVRCVRLCTCTLCVSVHSLFLYTSPLPNLSYCCHPTAVLLVQSVL